MTGFDVAWILSGILLVPYLVWGIYLLRMHLTRHIEFDRTIETFTIAGLVFFYLFQFDLLNTWLKGHPLAFMAAVLGLFVSGAALYGPMVYSFLTRTLVDIAMPTGDRSTNEPRYGAAEACELRGDYEAAANEYIAISRMFPKDSKSALRAADNLMKLDMPEEAAPLFEHGLANLDSADQSLPIANRLCEVYARHLGQDDKAVEILERYLERFPDARYAESVERRLERLRARTTPPGPAPGERQFETF